ncbi:thiamine phosphate synthase [Azospirillum sp.]|uniref:thiamine phosphate synthase n=1 Tax=Azospirillum sp. TaxID=34012 RepID=UPI002D75B2A5|nr:thiamine phosphate synthase [Azospirillum sp.]HYD64621.1 thiamine phosphate synthase [Azospirillum sp.]
MLPAPPVLLITDRHQAAQPLPELAERAFAAGLRWLSLRDKGLPDAERAALARTLVARARPWDATVTVHGDPELARAAGAAGVHLPDGGDATAVRALLGPRALIGVSAHDGAGLARAAAQGADYATLSPVFPSPSKPGYGPPLGLDGFARLAANAPLPVLALGGIDAGNAAAVRGAGAAGVAVMGALLRADTAEATARLLAAFTAADFTP